MRRQILIVSLAILVLLAGLPMQGFAADFTVNQKASILNQLKLIAGDGTGYNLGGQLKRSEAATFMVRLMGKEKDVTAFKDSYALYAQSAFTDVRKDAWYAAYVGFCRKNGIIKGFPDGTYKPDEPVSEKAFLTLVLKALGYTDDDFTWNTVYQKAYDTGIVSDISYSVKTEDNHQYIRGNVVEAMYNSLEIFKKDTNKTLVHDLIDAGIVTEKLAQTVGVLKTDETVMAITDIDVNSASEIEVTLNESPVSITKEQVTIVETDDETDELKVDAVSVSDKVVTIETNLQAPEKEYILRIENVKDTEGFTVNTMEKAFEGYVKPVVESPYFVISKVEAVNERQIDVHFTHPIDKGAELPLYFSIDINGDELVDGEFKNMAVAQLGGTDKALSLYLKEDTLQSGAVYTLNIKGDMTSYYGVKLNAGNGDSMEFAGTNRGAEQLEVLSIEAINKNYVRVEFNKDVKVTTATKSSNYKLEDKDSDITYSAISAKMATIQDGQKRLVDVKFPTLNKKHEYELTIEDIKDHFQVTDIDEYVGEFYGYLEMDELEIEHVAALDEASLRIYFNRALDPSSVDAIISFTNGLSKEAVKFDHDQPYYLTVFLDEDDLMTRSKEYEIIIAGNVEDTFGNEIDAPARYEFKGSSTERDEISISDAKFIADDTVLVEFSSDIHETSNDVKSRFKLVYEDKDGDDVKMTSDNVSIIDSRTVVVRFEDAESDENYDIEATNINDYTGQFTTDKATHRVRR